MIIFISTLLCTIQLVLQHYDCLNVDLQHGGAVHNTKWKLQSRRAPAMYQRMMPHTLPRKREIKTNFRRYWHGNKKPHNKVFFKASRRVYEDERDANLKNKLHSLTKQTLHDTEDAMKEAERIKQEYKDDTPYKAGFILAMLKKSRDVVNELFNVAIKHRDEWQALEQLKIFEIIVHTNIDTTHLLKQLIDLENGLDVILSHTSVTKSIDTIDTDKVKSTDNIDTDEVKSTDKIDTDEVKSTDKIDTDEIDTDEVKSTDKIDTDEVKSTDKIDTDEVKSTDKIDTDENIIDKSTVDTSTETNKTISAPDEAFLRFRFQSVY